MPEGTPARVNPLRKTLATKLSEIMGAMRYIPKEGFNAAQKYKFVRESDVAEKVSELLAERGIYLHQTVIRHGRSELYTTVSGNTMWLTEVEVEFSFIDGETAEKSPASVFVGYGADTGDKGIYKAITGAEKYFLMKTFLVSTGDDPEADDKVDRAAAVANAAGGTRVVRGSAVGVQRGGKSAIATAAQVNEIARQTKALRLTPETVLPIISASVGKVPENGQTLRGFLSAITSDEAGKIIAAMMDFKPIDTPVPFEESIEAEDSGFTEV